MMNIRKYGFDANGQQRSSSTGSKALLGHPPTVAMWEDLLSCRQPHRGQLGVVVEKGDPLGPVTIITAAWVDEGDGENPVAVSPQSVELTARAICELADELRRVAKALDLHDGLIPPEDAR